MKRTFLVTYEKTVSFFQEVEIEADDEDEAKEIAGNKVRENPDDWEVWKSVIDFDDIVELEEVEDDEPT